HLQGRRAHRERRRAGDAAQGGADGGGARGHAGGQPGGADRGHAGRRRGPGHLRGQILGRVVGEGAREVGRASWTGGEAWGGAGGPVAGVGVAGVPVFDWRAAAVTVRVVVPLTPPRVALMVEVPAATPVANPAALIVATPVADEAQVTCEVKFWVVLLEKVPV